MLAFYFRVKRSRTPIPCSFPVLRKMPSSLNSIEAALDGTCHGTSQRMDALYVRCSLYFSLIQGMAARDELATDWPHRHISPGCGLSSELPSRSTLPGVTEHVPCFSWMSRLSRFAASRKSSSLVMLDRSKTDRGLQTKKPRARLPETMFPLPSVMAQTEETTFSRA